MRKTGQTVLLKGNFIFNSVHLFQRRRRVFKVAFAAISHTPGGYVFIDPFRLLLFL